MKLNQVWQRGYARIQGQTLARVGKNALALLAGQVGARLFNLLLVGQLARSVGTAALGRYLLAMTVEALALAIVDLGLNPYVTREFSQRPASAERQGLWGTVLAVRLLSATLGCIVVNLAVVPLFFAGQRGAAIGIVSLALLPEAFSGLATARIKAQRRMEVSSAIGLGVRLASTLGGLLLLRLGYGLPPVLWAHVGASAAGAVLFGVALRRMDVRVRWVGWMRQTRGVLRSSAPFAVTGVVAILYMRLDLLLLAYWQGDAATGIYGAAYRLWEAIGMIPSSLLDALFPELSRLGVGDRSSARLVSLYRRGRRLMLAVIVVLMAPGILAAPWLVRWLVGPSADSALSVALLRLLFLAFPFPFLYLLDGYALYAVERQRQVTAAMVAATAIKAAAGLIAIPLYSTWGAAVAALVAEALLWVLLRNRARKFVLSLPQTPEPQGQAST